MQKILVTGATGYIGSSVSRKLAKNPNVKVICMTRQSPKLTAILSPKLWGFDNI